MCEYPHWVLYNDASVSDIPVRHGGVPTTDAYTPSDLAATIFHLMGIGPDEEFHDAQGRPYRIHRSTPIRPLLA